MESSSSSNKAIIFFLKRSSSGPLAFSITASPSCLYKPTESFLMIVFIRLVKKHFPRDHKLHKIFNTNTIKLSYCCTINMANIIKQHNSRIMSASPTEQLRMCNCRVKSECPMDGKCLTKCIVYKAEVRANNGKRVYYGASEGEFKTQYNKPHQVL